LIIFNNPDFTSTRTIKVRLLIILVVLLAYLRLAELATCVSYPAIFILPIKISLGITLLAAAWTNFLHPRTLPLCCIAQGLGSLDSFLLFSMHWVVLKKEIMLNVEDISLTWAK